MESKDDEVKRLIAADVAEMAAWAANAKKHCAAYAEDSAALRLQEAPDGPEASVWYDT